MNTKLKLHKKKLLYMGTLGLMLAINNSNVLAEENMFTKNDNNTYYRREQIYLIFDMKSGNCQEYLLNKKENNNYVLEEIYDIENNTVKFSDMVTKKEHEVYLNYLKNNPSIVFLEDLSEYFSNIDIKEYYTLNEIKFLEPYIFNRIANDYLDKVLSKWILPYLLKSFFLL